MDFVKIMFSVGTFYFLFSDTTFKKTGRMMDLGGN